MRMERWEAEAEFFDHVAEQLRPELEPLDPLTVVRYSGNLKPRFNKEYRFHLLGDLRGKRVLDLGCGEGSNAVLLATLGAEVTGIDISPKSIELATARARLDGVAERVTFLCAPIETAVIPPDTFDVIWGDGVLHHLIDELDRVLAHLVNWAKPDALALFSEPVNLSPRLRALRLALPIHTDATPDERPLEPAELDVIRRHLPELELKYFGLLARLDRYVLPDTNYERSPASRQLVANVLRVIDDAVLGLPGLSALASMTVMHARVRKAATPPRPQGS
jgi:2-polyprenyl-3-methyl-5-hydroxy-6-metoxy-1,4-benzoquinol methylase